MKRVAFEKTFPYCTRIRPFLCLKLSDGHLWLRLEAKIFTMAFKSLPLRRLLLVPTAHFRQSHQVPPNYLIPKHASMPWPLHLASLFLEHSFHRNPHGFLASVAFSNTPSLTTILFKYLFIHIGCFGS